jgi:hypothetical protein
MDGGDWTAAGSAAATSAAAGAGPAPGAGGIVLAAAAVAAAVALVFRGGTGVGAAGLGASAPPRPAEHAAETTAVAECVRFGRGHFPDRSCATAASRRRFRFASGAKRAPCTPGTTGFDSIRAAERLARSVARATA